MNMRSIGHVQCICPGSSVSEVKSRNILHRYNSGPFQTFGFPLKFK